MINYDKFFLHKQGSEWVLAKKSEKCVMPSSMGDAYRSFKELGKISFLVGGVWGSSPRNFWDSRAANGAFQCYFGSFYTDTHTPPKKNFSSDLH